MVHFVRTLGALTAVGFGLAALTVTARAKPPELPIDHKDTCAPADSVVLAGLLLPVEPILLPEGPPQPAAEPSACPYLQKKTAPAVDPVVVTFDTPLENLRKLIEAQRLYEKAERSRAAGETLAACATYEQAAKACPGSRFSAAATMRAAEMRAGSAAAAGQAECEEPADPVCQGCCMEVGCCAAGSRHVIKFQDVVLVSVIQKTGPNAAVVNLFPQPIAGKHLVRPDGTISLGVYGSVKVAGLTAELARDAIKAKVVGFEGGERFKGECLCVSVDDLTCDGKQGQKDCCKECPAGCCDLPVCIDLSAGSACCRLRVAVSFSAGKQLSIGVEAGMAPGPGACTVKVKAADGCGNGCVGTCLQHWLQVLGGCPCSTPEPKDAAEKK
jgi:hypothetical protein